MIGNYQANYRPNSHGCIHELMDTSVCELDSAFLLHGRTSRDPAPQLVRLAEQLITRNRRSLQTLDVNLQVRYDGRNVRLVATTGVKIGAISLLSPTTGKSDYGIVIRPRHGWSGIGSILSATGWRLLPTILSEPVLPFSDRKVPPWVLASIILVRLRVLLNSLQRRFELVQTERSALKGKIDWTRYVTRQISSARFLSVPCQYPSLEDDRQIKSAIKFALEMLLQSLQSQCHSELFVLVLIDRCRELLEKLNNVLARAPVNSLLSHWIRSPLSNQVFRDGITALEWTIDQRGLAGLSNLAGLPWVLPMDQFFEAWAETIMARAAVKCGGMLKTARKRETVVPLTWEPPYLGSQKFLIPDLVLELADQTIIVDAKYKDHWEEFQTDSWTNLDDKLRERHRDDLLQVLAYSTLARTKKVTVCLAYPCREATWTSLRQRERLFHRASVPAGDRQVELLLTAFPLSTQILNDAAELLISNFTAQRN